MTHVFAIFSPRLSKLAPVIALLLSGASVRAAEPPEQIPPDTSCVAEGCHKALKERKVVHEPMKQAGGCGMCHAQEGNKHTFSLAAAATELCTICHGDVLGKKHIHAPLESKKGCTECHDPHSSETDALLQADSLAGQCLQCHKQMGQGKTFHTEMLNCLSCHEPHSSDSPVLLPASEKELCGTCHADVAEGIAEADHVHGPAAVGCTACHNPHLRQAGKGLSSAGADLCLRCHETFSGTAEEMARHHSKLLQKEACLRCHQPHAGSHKAMLREDGGKLCLQCHDSKIERNGSSVANIAGALKEGAVLHGPLKNDGCTQCHEPHANANFGFLRGHYPASFYAGYTAKTYEFCLQCHDAGLASRAKTREATRFRNGTHNLHFLHVNKDRKGRTCRTCHGSHAAPGKHLLREEVPFGEWAIPIGFSTTENGGKCMPGCHMPKSYDRVDPVTYAGDGEGETADSKPETGS